MRKPSREIIYPGLVKAMEICEVTQTDISDKLGLSRQLIHRRLRGKIRISVEEALEIATLFPNWSVEDLFRG